MPEDRYLMFKSREWQNFFNNYALIVNIDKEKEAGNEPFKRTDLADDVDTN